MTLSNEALKVWQSQTTHLTELGVDTVSWDADGGFMVAGIASIVDELLDSREQIADLQRKRSAALNELGKQGKKFAAMQDKLAKIKALDQFWLSDEQFGNEYLCVDADELNDILDATNP